MTDNTILGFKKTSVTER